MGRKKARVSEAITVFALVYTFVDIVGCTAYWLFFPGKEPTHTIISIGLYIGTLLSSWPIWLWARTVEVQESIRHKLELLVDHFVSSAEEN